MKRLLVWLAFTAVLILMSCTPPPRGVVIGAPVVSMAYDSECAEVARGRIRYSRFDGLTTVQWTDSVAVVYLCGGHYEVWEIGRGFPVPYSTVQFHVEGGVK